MMRASSEEGIAEQSIQASTEDTLPPSPSLVPQPPLVLQPPRQHPPDYEPNTTDSPTRIYTSAITISIPSFSLPNLIFMWNSFMVNVRLRMAPILLRRSIVFYCVLFLMLQFLLMMFYQHRAGNLGNSDFQRGRRVEPDFQSFVNQRKDRSNNTIVLFVDNQNKEWIHNFLYDLKHLKMPNYIIFARDRQVCPPQERKQDEWTKGQANGTYRCAQRLIDKAVMYLNLPTTIAP